MGSALRGIAALGLALLAGILFGRGCMPTPEAAGVGEGTEEAEAPDRPDAADLLEADRAFASDVRSGGLEGWVDAFTDDALLISGGTVAEGPDSIRAAMAPVFGDPALDLRWEPEGARIGAGGDLGYTWGTYTVTEADSVSEEGRYLTVWRRQPDGSWKVEADVGSPR